MTPESFAYRLLQLTQFDLTSTLWWRYETDLNSPLQFYIDCSDVFFWGTSDLEPITPETLSQFEQALDDAGEDGPTLYCARRRQMRPQGATYRHIDSKHWPLFDACGPERPVQLGNPHPRPTDTGVSI